MRKLIVSTYATLDGRVDDLQDWVIRYDHEDSDKYHGALLEGAGGLVLGRRTYEAFARIWPGRAGELPYIDRINTLPKYVASATLTDLAWENSHLIEGDAVEGVAALKAEQGGDLVIYGCRDLTVSLAELVDEYRILIHPVLLGRGRPLLPDGAARADLELVDSTTTASGVVVLSYRRALTRSGRVG